MKEKIKNIQSRIGFLSFAIIILLIIIFLCYLIFFLTEFQINQDSLYWFFSTVAQSFLALIAFLGIFAVFKLQNLDASFNVIFESNKESIQDYLLHPEDRCFTLEEFIKNCHKLLDNPSLNSTISKEEIEYFKDILLKYSIFLNTKEIIKKNIKNFSLLTLALMVISIIFIPITSIIIQYKFGIISVGLILYMIFLSLSLAIRLMKSLLKDN